MKIDIEIAAFQAQYASPMGAIALKAFLHVQRELYYKAVRSLQASVDAYCTSTQNTSDPVCGFPMPPSLPEGVMERLESESYADPLYSGGTYLGWCELWQFPDGMGGFYEMYRNCNWVYVP